MATQLLLLTPPEALVKLSLIEDGLRRLWAPPPVLKVSEWADANIYLRKGRSAKPGPWRTESYQREILDALCDPEVGRIVVRKCTQMGFSEILNIIIGYFIDCDPKPIMMVQPTDSNAKQYSKKRIAPMVEDCPALRAKVRQAKSRKSGNTMLLKEFDGGFFKLTGANSGSGLRSDPVPVILMDEVDGYPHDVDGEGDPINIAEERAGQWDDAKIFIGSTPGEPQGISRIDGEYKKSSQALFQVKCPHCGFEQALWWRDPETGEHRLIWEVDEEGVPKAETVRYVCKGCRVGIEEKHKRGMLKLGRWVHRYAERTTRGYHINALYRPWKFNWHKMAKDWVEAQDNPEKLKTFINLSLGETWDEGGTSFDRNALAERREQYPKGEQQEQLVPNGVAVIVATVDVQNTRLEVQLTGFGANEESWLIAHERIEEDPGRPESWEELERFLLQPEPCQSGAQLLPAITLIDSGAHTDSVYKYVLPRQNARRRVYACKGFDFITKPGLADRGTSKKQNIILWKIATYAGKDRVLSRLRKPQPGPGYMHFPNWVTDEYLDQLTAEKRVTVIDKRTRRPRSLYIQTHPRNEALDLTVYAHAGLFVLQNHIDRVTYTDLRRLASAVSEGKAPLTLQTPRARRVRSHGVS